MAKVPTKRISKKPAKEAVADAPVAETPATAAPAAPEPMFEPPTPAEAELPAERTVDSITASATEDAKKDNFRFASESSGDLRPPSAPVEPTGEETRYPDRRVGGFQRDRIAT